MNKSSTGLLLTIRYFALTTLKIKYYEKKFVHLAFYYFLILF